MTCDHRLQVLNTSTCQHNKDGPRNQSFLRTIMNAAVLTQKLRIRGKRKQPSKRLIQLDDATPTKPTGRHFNSHKPIEFAETSQLNLSIRLQEKGECVASDDHGNGGGGGGGAVFFADNSDRFSQQCSLKLMISSLYDIRLETNRDVTLVTFSIGGKVYNCFNKYKQLQTGTFGHAFVWSTEHIKRTKHHHRSVLPCRLKFKGHREIRFDLLVKFYDDCDVRLYTGSLLTSVQLQVSSGKRMRVHELCYI